MSHLSSLWSTAFLIADATRAAMLAALMDGRALPAGELARAAGITAQTASSHLAKLLEGGLVSVETQGRHRYYRLAGGHVAQAIESLAAIRPRPPAQPRALGPEQRRLCWCRSCYDHLAGRVGVAITRALLEQGCIEEAPDKRYVVMPAGASWFERIGLDTAAIAPTRRGLARQCLDWTERAHHLAGPLGTRLMAALCERDWLRRSPASRVVTVTPKGWIELERSLGLTEAAIGQVPQARPLHRYAA